MNLSGKKLLLLGTNMGTLDIIHYARLNKAHVIVADNLPVGNSPGKQASDESWMISTTDVDALEKAAQRNGVDGIFAGVSELNLRSAMALCHRMGLPFYTTPEQWKTCSDKPSFKALCRKFDVPVVEEKTYDEHTDESVLSDLNFPLIIKPADGSAGRGISVCHSRTQLLPAIKKALQASLTAKWLAEPYLSGLELTIFYAVQNGKVFLTGMSDRYTRHGAGGIIPLPAAHIFPSTSLPDYINNLNSRVVSMFESLKLQNGMIFIQAFKQTNSIVLYEMGVRLTGTQEYNILERECGVNTLKMMVNYALTGTMSKREEWLHAYPDYKHTYALINFLVHPGFIREMHGAESVMEIPGVFHRVYEHRPGSQIHEKDRGTLRQIAFRVFAEAGNRNALSEIMKVVHNHVKIISDKGEDMLMEPLNETDILHA